MRIIVIVLSGFVLVGFPGGLLFGSPPQTIAVGYHEDFPPYLYEENDKLVGIFPEMVREAAVEMSKRVEFKKRPWRRLLRGIEAEQIRMDFNYRLGLIFNEGKVNEILARHGVKDEIQFPVR